MLLEMQQAFKYSSKKEVQLKKKKNRPEKKNQYMKEAPMHQLCPVSSYSQPVNLINK